MNKLSCEDLMVEDWVMCKDYPMRSKPMQIKPEHFVRSLIEFKPIPLTVEILEKNGFKFVKPNFMTLSEDKVWSFCADYNTYKITLEEQQDDNGKLYFVIRAYCGSTDVEIWIRYVHELQHTLKLCGIKKNIIL